MASDIGAFDSDIVEGGPESTFRQQAVGTHTDLLNLVHDEPSGRAQVLAESIVVPWIHEFAVGLWCVDDCSPQHIFSRDQGSAVHEKPAACVHNHRDMAFKQWEDTPEIGKDHIGRGWKRHAARELLEKLDFLPAAVGDSNFPCHLNDFTRLDGIHSAGAKLAGKYCENTRSRAYFHHNGPVANVFAQGLGVSVHADAIRNHGAIGVQAVHGISCALRPRFPDWVPSPVSHQQKWLRRGQKGHRDQPGDTLGEWGSWPLTG